MSTHFDPFRIEKRNSPMQPQPQPVGLLPQVARHLTPTLLIGLGGTGKDVLLRVRRSFFERYGHVGYPIIGYLALDTNPNAFHAIEGETVREYVRRHIQFRSSPILE